jgi:hypothetical protein
MDEDEDNFDPNQDIRDYDEVARSLPVFCVSSRAYQKLSGRLQKDNFNSLGFDCPEDTEIPQLQQHAQKLTEAGRAAGSRRFLNELSQLINSMRVWAGSDGYSNLKKDELEDEEDRLRKRLDQLQKVLTTCVLDL